jgi:hypothetical protein
MSSVDKTLEVRGSRYGTFENNATTTQSLMEVIEKAPSFEQLSKLHKEAIHMIFHKIARIVCGDPNYIDNVHDIVGYAKLLEDYLVSNENKNSVKPDPSSYTDIVSGKGTSKTLLKG